MKKGFRTLLAGVLCAGALCGGAVNIATMQLYRDRREGLSVMVLECDQPLTPEILDNLQLLGGVVRCIYLNLEEG